LTPPVTSSDALPFEAIEDPSLLIEIAAGANLGA